MTKEKLKKEMVRMYNDVREALDYNSADKYWKGKARVLEDIFRMMFKSEIEDE